MKKQGYKCQYTKEISRRLKMKYQFLNNLTSLQLMVHNYSSFQSRLTIKTRTKVWWTMRSKLTFLIFRNIVKHSSNTLQKYNRGFEWLVSKTVLHWWLRQPMRYIQAMQSQFPSLLPHSLISKMIKNLILSLKLMSISHNWSRKNRLKIRSLNSMWWRLLIEDQSLTRIMLGMISNQ